LSSKPNPHLQKPCLRSGATTPARAVAGRSLRNVMEHPKPTPKIGILQKVTNFLIGFFGGIMIFMVCLKIFTSMWGAFLGIGVNIIVSAYLLKIFKGDKAKKIAIIGVIASVVAVILVYLLLTALVFSMFSRIAG